MLLPAHLVFESLAYAAGFALYSRARKQAGDFLPDSARSSVIVAAILGAAVGSKVLGWFEDPAEFARHWDDWQFLLGGKTIVGGLLGGTIAVEWVKQRIGVVRRTGDLFAIPMTLAIAIGRIGCFLAGLSDHTYGIATTLPWGVDFGDGVKRHPTQIYEIVFLLALAAVLWRMSRAPHREGALYRVFLCSYLGFRLCIEFLKPDPKFAFLSVLQWVCLAALCWYAHEVIVGRPRPPVPVL